jgi:hypothetical protein
MACGMPRNSLQCGILVGLHVLAALVRLYKVHAHVLVHTAQV